MIHPTDFESSTLYFRSHFQQSKKLSLKSYSKKLGYQSSRLLELICQGKRLASEDFLFRFRNYASLAEEDFLALSLMVKREKLLLKNRDTSQVDQDLAVYRRKYLRPEKVEAELFSLISEWYFLVLRQIFKVTQRLDLEKLSRQLKNKVSPKELKTAVQTLQNLGMIEVQEDGTVVSRKPHGIFTNYDVPSQAARSHHKQMMDRAKEALEEESVLDREMISHTFQIHPRDIPKLKEEIRAFRTRLDKRYFDEKSRSVYQLNIQFFSHTDKESKSFN